MSSPVNAVILSLAGLLLAGCSAWSVAELGALSPGSSGKVLLAERTAGLPASHPLRGFDLAEEMWSFLQRHEASR